MMILEFGSKIFQEMSFAIGKYCKDELSVLEIVRLFELIVAFNLSTGIQLIENNYQIDNNG